MHRLALLAGGALVWWMLEGSKAFAHSTHHAKLLAAVIVMIPFVLLWLYLAWRRKHPKQQRKPARRFSGYPYNIWTRR